ncbi:MAG: hypothetical protein ACJ8FY_16570 [Gemmataceae bacterium]
MRPSVRLFILLAAPAFALPLLASNEPTPQELRVNNLLFKRWRNDPDHYARLKQDFRSFLELSAEDQERLRRFDRELHDESPKMQKRLWRVLDRYSTWLAGLASEDRRRIADAGDSLERLFIVKELRQKEWIGRLPRMDRERVEKAPMGEMRDQLIVSLRQEQRARRHHLGRALARVDEPIEPKIDLAKQETGKTELPKQFVENPKGFQPIKMMDFPKEVREYFQHSLRPMLSQRELGFLDGAEGQWPGYARALKSLSTRHPIKFPPSKDRLETDFPVNKWINLPPEWLVHIRPKKQSSGGFKNLTEKEKAEIGQNLGKWPNFALAIFEVAKVKKWETPKRQLGPCRPDEFLPEVERFIQNDLMKALTEDDKTKLRKAEGHWPDFPQLVMELSKENHLKVPFTELPDIPGLSSFWNKLPKEDK